MTVSSTRVSDDRLELQIVFSYLFCKTIARSQLTSKITIVIVIFLHCGSVSLLTLAAFHGKLEKDIIRHKNSSLVATLHYRHLEKRRS